MKDFFNAYDVLKVKRSDSTVVIKKAWLVARSKHHPDKGGDEEVFKKYKLAWECLENDSKREMHNHEIDSYLKAKTAATKNNSDFSYTPTQNYNSPGFSTNVLYEIHSTYTQLIEIMSKDGYCQFNIDNEIVKGNVKLYPGELLAYEKIYSFLHMGHLGTITSIKFTWDWDEPWIWHPKYKQTYNLYITEKNIRKGGRKTVNMPDGRRLAFNWQPVGKDVKTKGGLWVKLKNQGWPTNEQVSPDAWVHLNPISNYKSMKNTVKGFGFIPRGISNFISVIPSSLWKALLVIIGLSILSHYMSGFHF